jgi:cytochrome c oxidase subunit 2
VTVLPRQRGPIASEIDELWWLFLALGVAVYVLVIALLVVPMLRRRRAHADASGDREEVPARVSNRWIIGLGVVLPVVLLTVALATSVSTMQAIPRRAGPGGLVIDVVGYQFWWSAHYVDEGVTVANEVHIPVDERVELRLRSADVIHSFWVPDLQGKLDVLPDRTNTLVIEAGEPGTYGGECAEFCGLQHANMGVVVIAHPRPEFDAWLAAQRRPATAPVGEAAQRGQVLFGSADCASCHTIRGLHEGATTGPDLTHVASRQRLLSDTIDNTTAQLTAFLDDPDAVKDGTGMPEPELSDEQVRDLVAFLESLR